MAAVLFFFVKIKGMAIDSRDYEHSTPLHWATIQDSRQAIIYLLAMGADPNLQDHESSTVLHLAIKAAQKNDSTMSIR